MLKLLIQARDGMVFVVPERFTTSSTLQYRRLPVYSRVLFKKLYTRGVKTMVVTNNRVLVSEKNRPG